MGRFGRSRRTHLPPTVAVDVIPLYNFYTVSGLEIDFVGVFGNEVEQRINIFRHISYHKADQSPGYST
jgi:hypothetical protein